MVSSPRGSILTHAQVTDRIAPRVVHVSYDFEDANANLLTDSEPCDPITGSTGLKSCLCRAEKVSAQRQS